MFTYLRLNSLYLNPLWIVASLTGVDDVVYVEVVVVIGVEYVPLVDVVDDVDAADDGRTESVVETGDFEFRV